MKTKKSGGSRPNAGRPTATEPMIKISVTDLKGKTNSKQFRTTAKFKNVVEVVEEYINKLKM